MSSSTTQRTCNPAKDCGTGGQHVRLAGPSRGAREGGENGGAADEDLNPNCQKMCYSLKKEPLAGDARSWRSDACAPRDALGGVAFARAFQTTSRISSLSLRARSASASGGRRGSG